MRRKKSCDSTQQGLESRHLTVDAGRRRADDPETSGSAKSVKAPGPPAQPAVPDAALAHRLGCGRSGDFWLIFSPVIARHEKIENHVIATMSSKDAATMADCGMPGGPEGAAACV
jgi:hypothetical protein